MTEWSGSIMFVRKALEQQGVRMDVLGRLQRNRVLASRILSRLSGLVRGGMNPLTDPTRTPAMAHHFARSIEQHLKARPTDVLFAPSSIPLAKVRCDVPMVFYTDATFSGLIDTYSDGRPFPKGYLEQGHALEREALQRCSLAIYSSEWAARSAVEEYGADPDRVRVVPFGANMERATEHAAVAADIATRGNDRLELLFLGVAWERKGGPKALEVARLLHDRGVPVRLRIIGCVPPVRDLPAYVEVTPFVAKSTPEGRALLTNAMRKAHFLLLPTLAECFGIVFAEASAFGVPSITHAVGGVPTAVHHDRNGLLFGLDEPASAMADRILSLFGDERAYRELALSAHAEYSERLNWRVNGARLADLLREAARRGAVHPAHPVEMAAH
ncbi:MAG: glycosyltransferase family 4 protein [Flavobacteriales bacterium]|nr:glycosyltransferase family 4 protein [Flavobacteriales bacterium]